MDNDKNLVNMFEQAPICRIQNYLLYSSDLLSRFPHLPPTIFARSLHLSHLHTRVSYAP